MTIPNITIPYRHESDVWTEAEKIRAAHWNGCLPVNVELIAEKGFNFTFIPIDNLQKIVGAEAYITGDLSELHYDSKSHDVRLRFSIAHELGHAVLHETAIRSIRTVSIADWKQTMQALPAGIWGRAEWQAREFAGRLLVPKDALFDEVMKLKPKIEEAKNKVADLEPQAIYEFLAPKICKKFVVSDQVILARLKSESIDVLNLP
jgi:Zn-dependent peptidase ImmA (M78 family)